MVAESISEGAIGFSTSRIIGHKLPDGRDVPGTHAEHAELLHIAKAIRRAGGGLMQNVPNLAGDLEGELELIRKQAETSGDNVLFSITAGRSSRSGMLFVDRIAEMHDAGLAVHGVAIPRASGFVAGLVNTLPWTSGAWAELAALDFAGRLAAIDDPEKSARLVADAQADPGFFAKVPLYWLGDGASPDYVLSDERLMPNLANALGHAHAAETFLHLSRESRGKALFMLQLFNPNLDAVADLISKGDVLPGLGR